MKPILSQMSGPTFQAIVTAIAVADPTFVYNPQGAGTGCSYQLSDRGVGSRRCIIGQALYEIGLSEQDLMNCSRMGAPHFNNRASTVLHGLGLQDARTRYWANAVQYAQDYGATWADAINAAECYLKPIT